MHKPIRVCHLVENMDSGAVENWLARSFCQAKRIYPKTDWTFYCILAHPGKIEQQVLESGARVIHSPFSISQTLKFAQALRSFLKQEAFDVLHCHHDFLSALYLTAAVGLPIRRRLVHVHNTDESIPVSPWKQRLLLHPFQLICKKLANDIIGISDVTLDKFLYRRPRRPGRDHVRYYGVDTAPVRLATKDRSSFRAKLGMPEDAEVLLFMGRLAPLKNPLFVLEVLANVARFNNKCFAVFVGTGDLDAPIQRRASELNLTDRIRMLGWRNDGAYLMTNSDLFVFPRLEFPEEGLGLVVVEAQACGLKVLTSPGIMDDAIVMPELVHREPLASGAVKWAQLAESMLRTPVARQDECVKAVENSRFNLQQSVQTLISLYE